MKTWDFLPMLPEQSKQVALRQSGRRLDSTNQYFHKVFADNQKNSIYFEILELNQKSEEIIKPLNQT